MGRAREWLRSGLIRFRRERQKELRDPAEIVAAFEAFSGIEPHLSSARSYLESIERAAFAVYRRHGLPDQAGAYKRSPGEDWTPFDGAAPDPRAKQFAMHFKLASMQFPDDSEPAVAGAVLERAFTVRRRLDVAERAGDWDAIVTINEALALAQTVGQWRIEFGLKDVIAPTREQAAGRIEGGRIAGAKRKSERQREWAAWQDAAARIWTANPDLSKSAVARLVIRRLGLTETGRAVSGRIQKPERT